MTTTNTTSFAGHYLIAATQLMDAIATPSAAAFELAQRGAIQAINAAYVPGASWDPDPPTSLEQNLGQELARSIENAARAYGYVVPPAVRRKVRPEDITDEEIAEAFTDNPFDDDEESEGGKS